METDRSPEQNTVYNTRLYDPLRTEIAAQFIARTACRHYPSADSEAIFRDIDALRERCGRRETIATRDLWNMLAAAGDSMTKRVVLILSAGNYEWSRATVPLEQLVFFSLPDQFGNLPQEATTSLASLRGYLEQQPQELARQRALAEPYRRTENRPAPIIVRRTNDGHLGIDDGNRRAALALLDNLDAIEAYICETGGEEPDDPWIATAWLQNEVHAFRHAANPHDKAIIGMRLQLVLEGKTAQAEFRDRVGDLDTLLAEIEQLGHPFAG